MSARSNKIYDYIIYYNNNTQLKKRHKKVTIFHNIIINQIYIRGKNNVTKQLTFCITVFLFNFT